MFWIIKIQRRCYYSSKGKNEIIRLHNVSVVKRQLYKSKSEIMIVVTFSLEHLV